jgi:predicted porin
MVFMSQNPSWYLPSTFSLGAYNTGTSTNPSYKYPKVYGGWGQLTYWFTNNLFISGWYGYMKYNMSNAYKDGVWRTSGVNNFIQQETNYIVNLSYDVNPAMRLGVEWDYIKTKYANYGTPIPNSAPGAIPLYADRSGSMNAFRIGAWYFF